MPTFYETQGKALEYAPYALEIYRGCSHHCDYCFNVRKPGSTRDEERFFGEGKPIRGILDKVDEGIPDFAKKIAYISPTPRVLMSFGSDPYQPVEEECRVTRKILQKLGAAKIPFQVLTKNPQLALRDLDLFKQFGGHLASTILYVSDSLRAKWEPGAPPVSTRLAALKTAHDAGVRTWVSIEPVIDPLEAMSVINAARDFVDLWKVGKLNYMPEADLVDWSKFAREVHELLTKIGTPFIIKKDLAVFLPAGKPPKVGVK